ncbi:hypothetical protein MPTK1_1g21000 [Marchantia polymorpha subsp. ruderalis]|uniref:Uncharacterized protein n=2 Tax=Marchantia polymorpha TaxID=3197 RepID=A0AAF6ASH7_MARPO|nr:hypothetical protein MARPO_0001s0435 [Marchantia polymorpha]BBM99397.1 hypothetical protein Mp_1g21000 [Marchantia polymorpha subsp. ruderalis]|eukprot:PTQ50479.1 hypothetical protein MARPO_0001s0435 [Marchantia polymorpha]
MTTHKRSCIGFLPSHALQYALKITERHAQTKAVIGVSSLLCITFGMESGDVGDIVKTWTVPHFRVDLYVKHHSSGHPIKWAEYKAATDANKKKFFDNVVPYVNTIFSHFGNAAEKATILVEVAIVDVIIADMFFNSKDHGGITQQRALSLFKKPSGEIAPGKAVYEVVLKNKLQFDLVADHLASGLSFRQVVSVMHHTKARIGIRRLGCLSDTDVSNCARVLVACNLQVLRNLLALESNWAISLAVDASTHLEHSYFDVSIHMHHSGVLYNLHILTLPIHNHHLAIVLSGMVIKMIDVLCTRWRSILLGIGSDGANVMTWRIGGVVTLLVNETTHDVYRSWCLVHQADLVCKAQLNNLFDGQFMKMVNKIVSCLSKQDILIQQMGEKCPKMTTRWMAMGDWTLWQIKKRLELIEFFFVAAVCAIFKSVNKAIGNMQARNLLMSQHDEEIVRLLSGLVAECKVEHEVLLDEVDLAREVSGQWLITHTAVDGFLRDQGSYVAQALEDMDGATVLMIKQNVGRLIVGMINFFSKIKTMRQGDNTARIEDAPQNLPHQLSAERVAQIEDDHQEMRGAYLEGGRFATVLDICDHMTTFEAGWKLVGQRFEALRDWAEKDEYRKSMTDLSLEGVLQSKQFALLTQIGL